MRRQRSHPWAPLWLALAIPAAAAVWAQHAGEAPTAPAPDVTQLLAGTDHVRLPPPSPVVAVGIERPDRARLRERQIVLQEARTFWRGLIGVSPDPGLLLVDMAAWTALGLEGAYGRPGAAVRTEPDGILAVLPVTTSVFAEEAATAAGVSPYAARGVLLASDLLSEEGADSYAEAFSWVVVAEGLTSRLRIGSRSWWQTRLVGSAAAWLFLSAPRGADLAPGAARALEGWARFWTAYLEPVAVSLATAVTVPPASADPRLAVELDARLVLMGLDMLSAYGLETFGLLRQAWPLDTEVRTLDEALAALWEQMPELRGRWESRLVF